MKLYRIKNERNVREILEVMAETDLGYHVKITVITPSSTREYRDFISSNLFEALIKTGFLEDFDADAEAS